jgi:hypothetical protein
MRIYKNVTIFKNKDGSWAVHDEKNDSYIELESDEAKYLAEQILKEEKSDENRQGRKA